MGTVKQDVMDLLGQLPDDCTLEDVQYHLYVIEKIQRGHQRAHQEGTLSHQQAQERLGQWNSP